MTAICCCRWRSPERPARCLCNCTPSGWSAQKICVPEQGDFRLDLAAGDGAPSPQAALFAAADQRTPRPSPWPPTIAPDGALSVPGLTLREDAWFAADEPGSIEAAPAQALSVGAEGLTLRLRPGTAFKPRRRR